MALHFLKGDDQDRVYGLWDLGMAINQGDASAKCLLGNENRFGITKEDIKVIEEFKEVLKKLRLHFIMEMRCPDEMIVLQNEVFKLRQELKKK